MRPLVTVPEKPEAADRERILNGLVAYNDRTAGPTFFRQVAVLLADPESGETVGGLWGRIVYDWLFVELLYVPPDFRGQRLGSELIGRAEAIAREHGCAGVWLDTFEFQARPFYEGLGYELFGEIPDHPRGSARYMLKKRLMP